MRIMNLYMTLTLLLVLSGGKVYSSPSPVDTAQVINESPQKDSTKIKRTKRKHLTRETYNKKNDQWWIAGMVIQGVGLLSLFTFFAISWWAFLLSAGIMFIGLIISYSNAMPPPDNWLGRKLDFGKAIPAAVFLLASICWGIVGIILGAIALFG